MSANDSSAANWPSGSSTTAIASTFIESPLMLIWASRRDLGSSSTPPSSHSVIVISIASLLELSAQQKRCNDTTNDGQERAPELAARVPCGLGDAIACLHRFSIALW